MFEKFNIDSLYFASVRVTYPFTDKWDTNVGGMLMTGIVGYGYWTIVRQLETGQLVDLQNPSYHITDEIDSRTTSYTIDYKEPFSNYYTQNGTRTLSKRGAIKEAEKHYDAIHEKRYTLLKSREECRNQQQ